MKQIEVKTTKEHFDKYEALYQAKGSDLRYWESVMPATKAQIIDALENGTKGHLNEIELAKWDLQARSYAGWTSQRDGKYYSSLAEQVCLFKHIATFHIAKAIPVYE